MSVSAPPEELLELLPLALYEADGSGDVEVHGGLDDPLDGFSPAELGTEAREQVRCVGDRWRERGAVSRGERVFGYVLDRTREHDHEQRARRAEARYRALTDQLPLVSYTNAFDDDVVTVDMSGQVYDLLGYRPEEWIGRPGFFESILHEDDRDVLDEVARVRRDCGTFSAEYRLRARDGRVVWVHDESVVVCDEHGEPAFVQGYFVDVTDRHEREGHVLRAQKLEALGRVAGGIAHDFNNYLTAVAGYAELARREDGRAERELGAILATVERASALTQQLLAFARRQPASPRLVDLDDVLRGAEELLRRLAGRDVTVHVALCGGTPVRADEAQLEQVLLNLTVNAAEAMPAGGRLAIDTRRVELAQAEAARLGLAPGAYVALVVADEGVGMEEPTRRRLFEPFFTTKEHGHGLGLATVYGIVAERGGAIEVASAPGRGTTFRVLLPRACSSSAG